MGAAGSQIMGMSNRSNASMKSVSFKAFVDDLEVRKRDDIH